MRTMLDFAPLFRSSIGFDRMLDALETASRVDPIDNWPPYDIARMSEDDYRITMAVAGFMQDELTITQEQTVLMIAGQKADAAEENRQFLHRGIAGRAFQRRFELAEHVEVVSARLANGLLTIDLKRELPEEMKSRRIAITTSGALPKVETKQIGSQKAAA
jgi:molecular chaperone IbpA